MLREVEIAFRDAALDGQTAAAEALVRSGEVSAASRVAIYTNNITGSLTEVLENTFPAIRRHVGEENFAVLAGAFVRAQPPSQPCLDRFGDRLADFLDGFEPAVRNLPWLPDLARLEWAVHDSYFAEDAAPFDAAALADMEPEAIARMTFEAHPAARAVAGAYPVHSLWQADSLSEVEETGYQVLVARPSVHVTAEPVGAGEYVLFAALSNGEALGAAANAAAGAAEEAGDTFDVQAAFAALIQRGVFAASAPADR